MEKRPGALANLRILDLCGPEGQPCGRYLADLGADVILVEPPDGSPSRRLAPFAGGVPDPERSPSASSGESLYFLHFNTNKRGVVLDLESAAGQATLRRLVRTADAVIESFSPGHIASLDLGYEELTQENPGLVLTSITPFGQTGPYRDFRATDIVITSLGGSVHAHGEPERAPVTMPLYQAYQLGGAHAAFGTLMALWHRKQTGHGQQVDVSLLEVMAHMDMHLVRYGATQQVTQRRGTKPATGPTQYYRTRDGWAMLALTTARQWKEFVAWVGDPRLQDPRYEALGPDREAALDLIDEIAAAFIARFTTEEYLREGTLRKVTVAPANTPADFARDPHTAAYGFFTEATHPLLGRYRAPGGPAVYSQTPWAIRRSAPTLGQHTAEVLRELEGEWGTFAGRAPRAPLIGAVPEGRAPLPVPDPPSGSPLPLAGVRVIAFSRAWAAPFGTRFLADYGAEVIKVESAQFPEGPLLDRQANPGAWRQTNAIHGEIHRNKLSVTLDLHTRGGQELFKRLVAVSDVVVENNHPDAMRRFGLAYEDLRKVKPDIIMVSCPGYGSRGPMRDYVSVGQCLTSFTGLGYLWAYPGSPWQGRSKHSYPDFITSANLALAVMAALHHRRRTGEGQYVELPQFQAAAAMIGLVFLEQALNGAEPEARGNRDPNCAPQGIYPCRGDDRWCALSCPSDAAWRALAVLLGRPELAEDPRYATAGARQRRHEELDGLIAAWTRTLTAHQVMYTCQRAGVPAGVVATGEDLYLDPQLRARGYVVEIEHPAPGRLEHPGMTVRFSRTPGRVQRPAPALGQHTEEVLTRLLGLSDTEIARYREEGALR